MAHSDNASDNLTDQNHQGSYREYWFIASDDSESTSEDEAARTSLSSESDLLFLPEGETEGLTKSDFYLLFVLGTGGYGKVFLVQKRTGIDAGKLYAMKVQKKTSIVEDGIIMEHMKAERKILETVRGCSFIITLHYAFQTNTKLYLILDYMNGGELFSHMCKRESSFNEAEARFYVGEVILALEQLHNLGIIYRDLKPENLLLDQEGHIVLTDFGLSKQFLPHEWKNNPRAYSCCGTLRYMAPEMVQGDNKGYNRAVDWWSVGILTYELLTGSTPFALEDGKRPTDKEISKNILKMKPSIPLHLDHDVRQFITKLLKKNPQKRLGSGPKNAVELKEHDFFMNAASNFTWDDLEKRQITPPIIPRVTHELDMSNFTVEFKTMMPTDSSDGVSSNRNEVFQKYSFVATSILLTETKLRSDKLVRSIEKNQAIATKRLRQNLREFKFYQNYKFKFEDGILGDGSFSNCYKCTHKESRQEYAVKVMNRKIECIQEILLLRYCKDHENIVKMFEVYQNNAYTFIVMELLAGGELFSRARPFTEQMAKKVMKQLALAVQYLHRKEVIHRDLKPENILFATLEDDSPVKIIDFGFAIWKKSSKIISIPRYTIPYAAPEVLASNKYTEACDIWSLGVILYEMLSGELPFKIDSTNILDNMKKSNINFTDNIWKNISPIGKLLIKTLMIKDPEMRLDANGLLQYPWIADNYNIDNPA